MNEAGISLKDRALGAIWGSFVGDAAALGTHWIYDLDELGRLFPEIHGFETPASGHYHFDRKPGDQTHYGDAALLLLESVAACDRYVPDDYARRFQGYFGSSTYHGYKDHSTRETLLHLEANPDDFENGADDEDPATVTRLAPVVVAYQGAPEMLVQIASLTRFSQRNATAIAFATGCAELLEGLLHGLSPLEAVAAVTPAPVREKIEQVEAKLSSSVEQATFFFGQSCALPKSFPSALHAFLKEGDDFRRTILSILRVGGDNAGRAAMAGAWMGALHGVNAIPADWRERLNAKDRIERAAMELVARRS